MKFPARGLYVLTPESVSRTERLKTMVAAALAGGAVALQYRDKQHDRRERVQRATALRTLCREFGVPLIINDDVELADAAHADGVHLGRDDAAIGAARRILGPRSIIGVSCYNSYERAASAVDEGADYIAFGSFYSSLTKPEAPTCSTDVLLEASSTITRPIVAIGGITPKNAGSLLASGADVLAVISSVFSARDPEVPVREFAKLF